MAKVSIIMGSTSDMPVMRKAADFLEQMEFRWWIVTVLISFWMMNGKRLRLTLKLFKQKGLQLRNRLTRIWFPKRKMEKIRKCRRDGLVMFFRLHWYRRLYCRMPWLC